MFEKIKSICLKTAKKTFFRNLYFTYWVRPKKASEYGYPCSTTSTADVKFGIILQGPVKKEDDFTIETVKLYRKYYPNAVIVLSVWDSEPELILNVFKDLGCEVCVSKTFTHITGYYTINYQIQTSYLGIKKALDLGCTHIAKTRTDQRICAPDILTYMINLQKIFPLKTSCKAQERIISCSMGTFANRLYNISDLFMFGTASDMNRYYSCPFDERDNADSDKYDDQSNQIEYSKMKYGEIWLCSHYLEACGFDLKWTLEDSDYYRKELFLVVDSESIDQYWPKHTDLEYRWRRYKPDILQQVTFRDWLKQYCN